MTVWTSDKNTGLPSEVGVYGGTTCTKVFDSIKYPTITEDGILEEPQPMVTYGTNCSAHDKNGNNNKDYYYLQAPADSLYQVDGGFVSDTELVRKEQPDAVLTPVPPYYKPSQASPGSVWKYKQLLSENPITFDTPFNPQYWMRLGGKDYISEDNNYPDLRTLYFEFAARSTNGSASLNDNIGSIIVPPHMMVDLFDHVGYNTNNTNDFQSSATYKRVTDHSVGKIVPNSMIYGGKSYTIFDGSNYNINSNVVNNLNDYGFPTGKSNGVSSLSVTRKMPWFYFVRDCATGKYGANVCKNYSNYLKLPKEQIKVVNDADKFMQYYCFAKENNEWKYDKANKYCNCMRTLEANKNDPKVNVCTAPECHQNYQYIPASQRDRTCVVNVVNCIANTDISGDTQIEGNVNVIQRCWQEENKESGQSAPVVVPTTPTPPKNEDNYVLIILLIFIILIIIVSVSVSVFIIIKRKK